MSTFDNTKFFQARKMDGSPLVGAIWERNPPLYVSRPPGIPDYVAPTLKPAPTPEQIEAMPWTYVVSRAQRHAIKMSRRKNQC